jgi:hypothetical protein
MITDFTSLKIVDIIENKEVTFYFYRDEQFWYQTDDGFLFPIPLKDIINDKVTLLHKDNAILFMRWIKKYLDELKTNKEIF